ncbi:hypothetical protein [Mycolicibacter arupensis]|uniref:hypothetical protein n=1 Tax=Mycolicibacter arupensis TaxID=342002 RepID=UPI000A8E4715|nr:hypothetical protein [Mycolicibacter arupensis]MCV7277223.1 hypothetical protein [Mycolicibacter arupensis]
MRPTLRPFVTAGVAVLGGGLISVTPIAAPAAHPPAVALAAAEVPGDLAGLVGGTWADAATSEATLALLDPEFWQMFWADLFNPDAGSAAWLDLVGAIEELPLIGPLLWGVGLFVVFPGALLLAYLWSQIAPSFDSPQFAAAADAAVAFDPSSLIHDVSAMLDPGVLTSGLDLTSVVDVGAVFDPDASLPDLGGILAGLIP